MIDSALEEILSFAIEKEAETAAFYDMAQDLAENSNVKDLFKEMAQEEHGHKELLEGLKGRDFSNVKVQEIPDLKISDYLQDVEFSPSMSYQDFLIFAMKNEEKSLKLYTSLGKHTEDDHMKKLLSFLAQEEARHKLRLETEYDEYVLTED